MANSTPTPAVYGRHKYFQKEGIVISTIATGSGATVTVTFSKNAGSPTIENQGVVISQIFWSLAAATGGLTTIQISDGTIVWGPHNVPSTVDLRSITFDPPLLFNTVAATSVVVTLTQGGTPVNATLQATGWIDGASLIGA